MGLENVKEEILNNAKKQANIILEQAKEEAKIIIRNAEKEVKEHEKKKEEDIKKLIETMNKREIASAKMDSKKLLLNKKKEAINEIENLAKKEIKTFHIEKRKEHISNLFEKAKARIDIGTIYCNKKDAKFIQGFNVSEIDIAGGIIIENREKTIKIDYRYESFLERVMEKNMQEISKIMSK